MKLQMIVEWKAQSLDRFDYKSGVLVPRDPPWPKEWGPAPVNYGCIPSYFNPFDKADLDAIGADPTPLEVGTWLEEDVLGMLWLSDFDHKIILGNSIEHLPMETLEAWFAGRGLRLADRYEAIEFILGLPTKP